MESCHAAPSKLRQYQPSHQFQGRLPGKVVTRRGQRTQNSANLNFLKRDMTGYSFPPKMSHRSAAFSTMMATAIAQPNTAVMR
jgi:hypothetical protein